MGGIYEQRHSERQRASLRNEWSAEESPPSGRSERARGGGARGQTAIGRGCLRFGEEERLHTYSVMGGGKVGRGRASPNRRETRCKIWRD